jgi:hypothetical protein
MRTNRGREPRNRALRATFPIGRLDAGASPFFVAVGPGRLDMTGCSGRLEDDGGGTVEWELRFETQLPPITPTPEWGARIATCYMEPHPRLRVSGTINEDGVITEIDGLLGEQAHVFGAKHSRCWHWSECKHLGAGDRAFVGVAAWPELPGGIRSVTSLYLDLGDGRRLLRNRTLDLFKPRSRHSPEGWNFDAEYATERLSGSITPRRDDLIGVTYRDPSGTPVYCYHSELADAELSYFTRPSRRHDWRLAEHIQAPNSAAFEYGSFEPLEGVPLLLG